MADKTPMTDVDTVALNTLTQLLSQYAGLEHCQQMLARVVAVKETLVALETERQTIQDQIAQSTKTLHDLEGKIAVKARELEARVASRKADLAAQVRVIEIDLEQKQRNLDGWHVKATHEVAQHEQLIRDMQTRLALVQDEHRQADARAEEARTRLADLAKKFSMA